MNATAQGGAIRYSHITEAPGVAASAEQIRMLETRYWLATRHLSGGSVLEVGCGTGIGLGILANSADTVFGLDLDDDNLEIARRTHAGVPKVSVQKGDAHSLPFQNATVTAVVCYEAIYYFKSVGAFFDECVRVLTRPGKLILCTVNPRWSGFSPSPYATRYLSPGELLKELEVRGFQARLYAAFEDQTVGAVDAVLRVIRRLAVRLHLIPQTMRGRGMLKKLFGATRPLPSKLVAPLRNLQPLVELDRHKIQGAPYKVFYVVAERR